MSRMRLTRRLAAEALADQQRGDARRRAARPARCRRSPRSRPAARSRGRPRRSSAGRCRPARRRRGPSPKEEKNERCLRLSTAPTHSRPSLAAGCSQTGTPLLPAAATTTRPAASARRIAASISSPPLAPTIGTSEPSERLMTCAPCGARPVDAGGDVLGGAAAVVAEHAHRQQLRARRDGGDADAVAGRRRSRSRSRACRGRCRPAGVSSSWTKSWPGQELAGEVGMAGCDAGVDDRDHRARAGGRRVRGVGLDQVEVPLLAAARVARRERGGGGRTASRSRARTIGRILIRTPTFSTRQTLWSSAGERQRRLGGGGEGAARVGAAVQRHTAACGDGRFRRCAAWGGTTSIPARCVVPPIDV